MAAYTPNVPSTFDLVKQFDAMRGGTANAPMSTSAYKPPEQSMSAAHSAGDGHDHSGGADYTPTTRKGLGNGQMSSFGGYQFASDFTPFVQDIVSRYGGLRVSSGYRSPEANRAANGVQNSYHLTGNAVDLSGSEKDMQAGAAYARSQGYRVLIHNAGSGQHLHISK
jgi:hypothetical protein